MPIPFALDPRIRTSSFFYLSVQLQCHNQMDIVAIQFIWAKAWSEKEFLFCTSKLCLAFPFGFLSKNQVHLELLRWQNQERSVNIYLGVAIMLSMTANLRSVSKVYAKTWILIKVTISAEIQPLISCHISVKEPFEIPLIKVSKPIFVFPW